MTFPRQQIEAIARAVEAAGGNLDDVCDLCWVWGRVHENSERRAAAIRTAERLKGEDAR